MIGMWFGEILKNTNLNIWMDSTEDALILSVNATKLQKQVIRLYPYLQFGMVACVLMVKLLTRTISVKERPQVANLLVEVHSMLIR